ncbi:unnamed protein product [Caenorhabditis bovis]|uniref:Uncharacterized protein n=1 Tax=Caenorhabditis bovis TaxID=2654633 RepID=A0A8S1EWQ1_9PELO|nr:unnamed protein product [Caenorhabditis bovis]
MRRVDGGGVAGSGVCWSVPPLPLPPPLMQPPAERRRLPAIRLLFRRRLLFETCAASIRSCGDSFESRRRVVVHHHNEPSSCSVVANLAVFLVVATVVNIDTSVVDSDERYRSSLGAMCSQHQSVIRP